MIASAVAMIMATAVPQQAADAAGLYLTSQMEIAGALELNSDGRFRYQLEYGAVSESAEGDWAFDGRAVRLTSNPMPKLPDFALLRDDPAPAGELYVALEDGGLSWTPLSVDVTVDGFDSPLQLDAETDGRILIPDGRRATSVKVLMPVYETGGDAVELSADRGHRLVFRLQSNDMGKALFRGEPLALDGSSMIMRRYDTVIIFRRTEQ